MQREPHADSSGPHVGNTRHSAPNGRRAAETNGRARPSAGKTRVCREFQTCGDPPTAPGAPGPHREDTRSPDPAADLGFPQSLRGWQEIHIPIARRARVGLALHGAFRQLHMNGREGAGAFCRWAGPFTENERCAIVPGHASQSGAGTKTLSFLPTGGKSPLPARSAAPSKCSYRDWPRVGLGEIGTVICCHPPYICCSADAAHHLAVLIAIRRREPYLPLRLTSSSRSSRSDWRSSSCSTSCSRIVITRL